MASLGWPNQNYAKFFRRVTIHAISRLLAKSDGTKATRQTRRCCRCSRFSWYPIRRAGSRVPVFPSMAVRSSDRQRASRRFTELFNAFTQLSWREGSVPRETDLITSPVVKLTTRRLHVHVKWAPSTSDLVEITGQSRLVVNKKVYFSFSWNFLIPGIHRALPGCK